MTPAFKAFIEQHKEHFEPALANLLDSFQSPYTANNSEALLEPLRDAMNYSLLNGGKRVRPMLVYAAAQALGNTDSALDTVASCVEMIHCYSLIHDDLPAMDDDDLRRGQATCHKAFDEATAILAGDAFQSLAFEKLSSLENCSAESRLQLIHTLAQASGPCGMVGGQAIDLAATDRAIDIDHLEALHQLKTGALIRAAVAMGAIFAGADSQQLKALDDYALAIGLSFQVQDDILDIESDTETLGKQQGADQALNKATYPSLLGLEQAKQKAGDLHQQALSALAQFDEQADPLRDLSAYIISRRH
jgi:geranylgeranyl pyrophosphate synthase